MVVIQTHLFFFQTFLSCQDLLVPRSNVRIFPVFQPRGTPNYFFAEQTKRKRVVWSITKRLGRWALNTLLGGPDIKADRFKDSSQGIRRDHRSSLRPTGPFISSNGSTDESLKNKRSVPPVTTYDITWTIRACRNFDFTGYTWHISAL